MSGENKNDSEINKYETYAEAYKELEALSLFVHRLSAACYDARVAMCLTTSCSKRCDETTDSGKLHKIFRDLFINGELDESSIVDEILAHAETKKL